MLFRYPRPNNSRWDTYIHRICDSSSGTLTVRYTFPDRYGIRKSAGVLKGMDFELLKNLAALVVAIVPLIVLIFAIFRTQIDRSTEPIDSPLLQVVYIKRQPVDNKIWEKERSKFSASRYFVTALILWLLYGIFFADTDPFNPIHIFTNPLAIVALLYSLYFIYLG
jgi:hypothetical protein